MAKRKVKTVFALVLLHEEEGEQDPKGVFSSKVKLKTAIEKMKSDLGVKDFEEEKDFRIYEVPFDEV